MTKAKATSKDLKVAVKEILVALQTEVAEKEGKTVKKVTNRDAEFAIKAVGQAIFETLAGGENAGIQGLGTLELRERGERKGRNPQTGEELIIEARTGVGIKPSKALKDAVKGL